MAERTAYAKGTGFVGSVTGMRLQLGDERWHELLAQFTEEERQVMTDLLVAEKYSLDIADKLYRTFVRLRCNDDMECAEAALRQLGVHIAESDLGGVYSIVLSLKRPRILARLLPKQWELYFPGVEVEVESIDLANRRVVNIVRGLGPFAYISPCAAGWMERAFLQAGATDVSVRETEWDSGKIASDDLRFVVEWT